MQCLGETGVETRLGQTPPPVVAKRPTWDPERPATPVKVGVVIARANHPPTILLRNLTGNETGPICALRQRAKSQGLWAMGC
jgi:hypothetical protein